TKASSWRSSATRTETLSTSARSLTTHRPGSHRQTARPALRRTAMATTIRTADYQYVIVDDRTGEGARVLSGLRQNGVNLLASCGFPIEGRKAQLDLVPQDPGKLRAAAEKLGLGLSDRKQAFLIEGDDRIGAAAELYEKLAAQGIDVVASQAVCAGA